MTMRKMDCTGGKLGQDSSEYHISWTIRCTWVLEEENREKKMK